MSRLLLLAALLAGCDAPAMAQGETALEFHIDPERVTVSGLSSGAYMAGQLHVAHSSLFSGAGLLAGGPYRCAGGSVQQALGACAGGGEIDIEAIAAEVRRLADRGAIDDPDNLRDDRVWIFRGARDAVVGAAVTAAAVRFYARYLPPANIAVVEDVPAGHGMPTVSTGAPCEEMAAPFLNACGFDAAGELLEHLYGPLEKPTEETGELRTLDQRPFADAGLWDRAFVYAPEACIEGATCGLHVALHGCLQSAERIGDAFAKGAGYNRWAESNRLVILYPQVRSHSTVNPMGCWDWWGYTGDEYATKAGKQVAAVKALVGGLLK